MRPIVDTSHFWMSDHSRFWYHLVGHEMVNLGAILITDTGKMVFGVKIQITYLAFLANHFWHFQLTFFKRSLLRLQS